MAARIQSLEQTVTSQRVSAAEDAHKTQQSILFLAGSFGLADWHHAADGLFPVARIHAARANFRATAQLNANSSAVHQLAAPGRATVESSTSQLLNVVGRLEQRIHELESGQKMLPEIAIANAKPSDLLTEGKNIWMRIRR